jgi:hypothetical protein
MHGGGPNPLSVPTDTVKPMSDASPWASTAGNKFREVSRHTGTQTNKLLAEGLTALAEALRELDANAGIDRAWRINRLPVQ